MYNCKKEQGLTGEIEIGKKEQRISVNRKKP
jgi:hypothetical protein